MGSKSLDRRNWRVCLRDDTGEYMGATVGFPRIHAEHNDLRLDNPGGRMRFVGALVEEHLDLEPNIARIAVGSPSDLGARRSSKEAKTGVAIRHANMSGCLLCKAVEPYVNLQQQIQNSIVVLFSDETE